MRRPAMVLTVLSLALVACSGPPERDEAAYAAAFRETNADVADWSDQEIVEVMGDQTCALLDTYPDVTESLRKANPSLGEDSGVVLAARHLCPEHWAAVEPLVN
jgi:hypothetical protein